MSGGRAACADAPGMASGRDRARGSRGQPSVRQLRVGETLRQALSAALERGAVRDPDAAGVPITVTEVRMSADLRTATAYVMPLGGDGGDRVLAALRRAAPALRRAMGRAVALKYVPGLRIEIDSSFDRAMRIDRLLDRARGASGDDG